MSRSENADKDHDSGSAAYEATPYLPKRDGLPTQARLQIELEHSWRTIAEAIDALLSRRIGGKIVLHD